jgi:hypothetical protein
MSDIYGILGIKKTDGQIVRDLGQGVIYDAIEQNFAMHVEDMARAMGAFVETDTEKFQETYRSEGGGYMQRKGGSARAGTTKPSGGWTVAYPLDEYGDEFGWGRKKVAYMTLQEVQRFVNTVIRRDINTNRLEMLRALFNNTARSYQDEFEDAGVLTIQPLANNDAVLYPPKITAETPATDNHYLVTGYAPGAISDTNNPLKVARRKLEGHYGYSTGFGNCVTWINSANSSAIEALTEFDPVPDSKVMPGDDTDIPMWDSGLPVPPGRLLGRSDGVWVFEWDLGIPANYMLTIDLDAARPLKRRIHPNRVGLPSGLQLVTTSDSEPLEHAVYENDYGFGCGDRRAGVVTFIDSGSTYTIPTKFNY